MILTISFSCWTDVGHWLYSTIVIGWSSERKEIVIWDDLFITVYHCQPLPIWWREKERKKEEAQPMVHIWLVWNTDGSDHPTREAFLASSSEGPIIWAVWITEIGNRCTPCGEQHNTLFLRSCLVIKSSRFPHQFFLRVWKTHIWRCKISEMILRAKPLSICSKSSPTCFPHWGILNSVAN